MLIKKSDLTVKKSNLPDAGKGLFTKVFIPKGTPIVEYTGTVSTWEDADHRDGKNVYIYYVNRNHVIDAHPFKNALARYANDANGLTRKKGICNNAIYERKGQKIFISATKNILPGEEILVGYGKEYWDVIKTNFNL